MISDAQEDLSSSAVPPAPGVSSSSVFSVPPEFRNFLTSLIKECIPTTSHPASTVMPELNSNVLAVSEVQRKHKADFRSPQPISVVHKGATPPIPSRPPPAHDVTPSPSSAHDFTPGGSSGVSANGSSAFTPISSSVGPSPIRSPSDSPGLNTHSVHLFHHSKPDANILRHHLQNSSNFTVPTPFITQPTKASSSVPDSHGQPSSHQPLPIPPSSSAHTTSPSAALVLDSTAWRPCDSVAIPPGSNYMI